LIIDESGFLVKENLGRFAGNAVLEEEGLNSLNPIR